MKTAMTLVLMGLVSLAVALWAASPGLAATDAGGDAGKTTADKTEPPKDDAAKTADKPKDKPAVQDVKKDKPADPPKDPAAANKTEPTDPYEKKIAEIQKLVDDARKMQDKIADQETKVEEQISKLTDSRGKPVDKKKLSEELNGHAPGVAANKYRELTRGVISMYAAEMGLLSKAFAGCTALAGMKAPDDAAKTRADTLTASVKEQCLATLKKIAGLYERIGDKENTTNCYRQMLAIDKSNTDAQNYLKELEKDKKNPRKGSGGSGAYSGGAGQTGRSGGY